MFILSSAITLLTETSSFGSGVDVGSDVTRGVGSSGLGSDVDPGVLVGFGSVIDSVPSFIVSTLSPVI
ncbi:hypothetical protein HYV57_03365 [Candidatus Peregrinibacteria bacterium]|nr:hypothetical protein [Candidatus Peregrinibacteria bacterium]